MSLRDAKALNCSFLTALAKDFEQYGIEAIRICRIERPSEYVKIVETPVC